MTSFVPHTEHAEDQPHARAILTFHVLRAGAAAGSIISAGTATLTTLYYGPRTLSGFGGRLLRHSARGIVFGTVFSGLALAGRMWGREEVEWQDRSWRLLENQGQMEVDNWLLAGSGIGAAAVLLTTKGGVLSKLLGGAGVGMTAGTVGYMGWRYGVNGGKFPEKKPRTPSSTVTGS